jgi:hypothetical protein
VTAGRLARLTVLRFLRRPQFIAAPFFGRDFDLDAKGKGVRFGIFAEVRNVCAPRKGGAHAPQTLSIAGSRLLRPNLPGDNWSEQHAVLTVKSGHLHLLNRIIISRARVDPHTG